METIELYEIARELGIDILNHRLPGTKMLSVMGPDGSCAVGINSREILSRLDEKSRLAHELGHCMTGSFYNIYSPVDIRGRHEFRADRKAAFLLVPLDKLVSAVHEGIREVWRLAETFDVSEDSMQRALEIYQNILSTEELAAFDAGEEAAYT
ncbi:ImmA/IrrE family metallo-endopeptidase [Oscillospiraceae bacterium OttesenSCG-928-G22]|nr:ImmA/IrrE family metallo-endopeptidase [Oscillospiraceae bacterium OttesenSCG-928-G22]